MRNLTLVLFMFVLLGLFFHPPQAHAQSCTYTPTSSDSATTTFSVSETNTYTIWTRLVAPDSSNNSIYLQIDGGCAVNVADSASMSANLLTWVNYQDGNTAKTITMNLASGSHTLKLTEREGGVGVDKIIVTSNTACTPTGDGANCPVPTLTPTVTPTPTIPPTPTPTIPPTPTPTTIPTATPTPTKVPTPTPTNLPTPTPTPSIVTYNINPTDDSFVNSFSSSTNYGTRTSFTVGGFFQTQTSYLKFNLASLAGKTIVSAKLRLQTTTDSSSNTQNVKPVSDILWKETTLTYNNRPAITNTVLGTIASGNAQNAWQEVILTSTVAANTGKQFSLAIDSSGSDSISFSSKEATNKPVLVIQAR